MGARPAPRCHSLVDKHAATHGCCDRAWGWGEVCVRGTVCFPLHVVVVAERENKMKKKILFDVVVSVDVAEQWTQRPRRQ